jgi:ferric-dicitrate binding protein FerR (iron transport regulator)
MDIAGLERFFNNQCSDLERQQAIAWLLDPKNDSAVKQWMREHWDAICALDMSGMSDNPDIEKIWRSIQKGIESEAGERGTAASPPSHILVSATLRYNIKRVAAAAAVLLVLSFGTYYLLRNKSGAGDFTRTGKLEKPRQDISAPTGNKAVLTLADGSKVKLDSIGNGILATQGSAKVAKKHGGEIVYEANHGGSAETPLYNTLSLPKGSRPVHLELSDGSIVWLNAASSITYPTFFTGSKREVSITGEAYFEIVKQAASPFIVSHDDVLVQVLGTRFNVNTYSDAAGVRVTLLDGAIDVSRGLRRKRLRPGQQVRLSGNSMQVIPSVDLEEVMAWKNNQFYFTGTDIKTIMDQLERYYNVTVQYRDSIPYKFVAKISRDISVSQFLEKLELTNLVHFKIDGNKIIVTK